MRIHERTLLSEDGTPILTDVAPAVSVTSPAPDAAFLHVAAPPAARTTIPLGRPAIGRWLACHRYEPFWMRPAVGTDIAALPPETQVLFGELPDRRITLLVPLIAGDTRCSLEGASGELAITLESPPIEKRKSKTENCVFIAVGRDLLELCRHSAALVARQLGVRLLHEKPLPPFIDRLGWCTWDAFYQQVSAAKVRVGLTSLAAGGIIPGWMILDDGWQSVADHGPESGRRLAAFEANEKFPGGLAATVQMARQFGVEHVLVWHTLQGYWGGVDPQRFAAYHPRNIARQFSPGILHHWPDGNSKPWGRDLSLIDDPERFFDDYHAALAAQGIAGVKVDNQATLEGLSGEAGRVATYRRFQQAVEASARRHFAGNLIHCMACANDLLYFAQLPIVRTSGDFMPRDPELHGRHVWTNGAVATWFGQFILPDWDMFQSGHEWGAFHAAARIVSGGPVYISDKPGGHDFALLRTLVGADGRIRRCDRPGMLTRDCLFHDPTREEVLLKIASRTGPGGLVGIFNCHTSGPPLSTRVSPADIEDLPGDCFSLHAERTSQTADTRRDGGFEVRLAPGEWELVTVASTTATSAATTPAG